MISTSLLIVAMTVARAWSTPPQITGKLMDGYSSKAHPDGTTVDMVVLYFSSDVVVRPQAPYDVNSVIATYKVSTSSTQYLVARDGKIFRLVSEDNQAFHAGKGELPWEPNRKDALNQSSIGIEMLAIGTKDEMKDFLPASQYDQIKALHPDFMGYTASQYKSVDALLSDLVGRRPLVRMDRHHIVAHSEYAPGRKHDQGALFDWSKIHLSVAP